MNKDKEPLLSAEEWILIKDNSCDETWSEDTEDLANEFKRYAKYHTEWHKNNEKWYSDEDMDKAYDKGFKDAMFKYRE